MPSSPLNRLGDSVMDSLALPYRGEGAPSSDAPSSQQHILSQTSDGSRFNQPYRAEESTEVQRGGHEPTDKTEKPRRPTDTSRIDPIIDTEGEKAREAFSEFLRTYHEEPLSGSPDPDGDGMHAEPYYLGQIRRLNLGQHRSTTVYVDFSHLLRYNADMAQNIVQNYQQ
jgi:DNA replication licensing factor MCM6